MQVGGGTLKFRRGPEWRFYFLLTLCVCIQMYECYPVFITIMKGFLSIAMRERLITSSESRRLLERTNDKGSHHDKTRQPIAAFLLDHDLAMIEPEAGRGQDLAEMFNELALFNEMTTGNLEEDDEDLTDSE